MSEVARIKAEIESAYHAAHLALHGLAIVSRHEIITKHMERVQSLHQELVPLIGTQEAIQTVIDIAEKNGG